MFTLRRFSVFSSAFALISALSSAPQAHAQAKASQAMGQGLFEQKGGNSCMFCHGIEGHDGSVKTAAKLTEPKTWKSYKATGGDEAKMADAVKQLIIKGAIAFNSSYKGAGFDWKKTDKLNVQMMGLTGGASQAWLKKFKDKGVTPEIAAESLWLHIKTLDKQNFFKK